MKKHMLVGMTLVFSIVLSGCTNKAFLPVRDELEDLELVRAIGVDKSPDNLDHIRLTVTSKREKRETGGGKKEGQGPSEKSSGVKVKSSDGKTAFEAERKFQTFNEKQVFWGHADYYIIGEEAARDDLIKYLDLLSRGQELRLNSTVYVVKDATAQELMEISQESEIYIPDLLKSLSKNIGFTSTSGKLEQIELMGKLDDKYSQVLIPTLHILKKKNSEKEESDDTEVKLEGYAVIRNTKLIAFANKQQSMGINFITNKIKSGVLNLKDSTGKEVSVEIVNSDTKIIPRFYDDTVSVLIKVAINSNVTEMHSTLDIFKENELLKLEEQQAITVKQYLLEAIKLAQTNDADILGIANKIYHKHPVKWQSINYRWNEIFPKIKFDIEVASTLKRSYDISQPNKYKAGEEK